ncbi:hypothetical protein Salat_0248000 [Sesamum alatum]|uniref:Uncharacterized protein n=1 Tax=Sesamum alatum TaxID=300844 RepID=A0AAE2CYC5_9LAMI|nr:hypothetical protein Salat_0248000 [Sesamum alatum]
MCEDIPLRPQPSEAPRSATHPHRRLSPAGEPSFSFYFHYQAFLVSHRFNPNWGLLTILSCLYGGIILIAFSGTSYVAMDLKLKGKFWAGNIYHQFESICQDVDDFMSKETMKFVENQVQSVGVSVKRFYSNVVQDILPLAEDIVEPKALLEDGGQVDTQDHVNSVAGMRTAPTCINEEQLSENHGSIDTLRNSDALLPFEIDHMTQFPKPPDADSSEEAKTLLHLREDGDGIIQDYADNGVEENIPRGSAPVAENEIFAGTSDEDNKNSTRTMVSSPTLSAHEAGHLTIEKERISCNSFSEYVEYLSNTSSGGMLLENKLPVVEDTTSDENTSLSAASAVKVNEDNSVLMDSQPPSACDVVHRSFVKNGILGGSFSAKGESFDVSNFDQSPELVFSYFSCDDEEEEEETDVSSSKSCISPKSSNILESTSASFINKDESIDHSEAERNISTPSSRTAVYETKAVDTLPAISILKSNDDNTFPSDGSDFVDGSFKSMHGEHYNDGQFALSPFETENEHEFGLVINDLDMETVDLSSDVKHDERTVPLTGNYARVASHNRRNFRYYKKLIQDAFTSRKRLSKEYEHLSILYGDIDMESSQHFEPRSLPSFPHTYADAVRTASSQEAYETEWELL